ncbi:MAG: DUF4911 domain-containing protein [bacterium]|nr:DUF4911 domain-containing protein [bacterium]
MNKDTDFTPVFLKLPRDNIVLFKFTLESYEGVGIVRTLDADSGLLVVLALKDTLHHVMNIIESVSEEFGMQVVEKPDDLSGDWLFSSLAEG